MSQITLGSTGIVIEKNGMGCLPIQRISKEDSVYLLHKAMDGGINFFDTARAYTDSEEKMGYAFQGRRDQVVIATKSGALTGEQIKKELEESLRNLGTDHIDLYQFHNPPFCPKPGGEDGLYDAILEAKAQGKILHIGLTNHRLPVAREAIESGLYDTLQFPYSYLSGSKDQELVDMCRERGIGFIAMKGMSGGLLRNGTVAAAWMAQQEGVVPIWGVQHEWELDQFLACVKDTPVWTREYQEIVDRDRKELTGNFCRSCGYCMPCPVGIDIPTSGRVYLLATRSPYQRFLTDEFWEKQRKVEDCLHCGQCSSRCPYGLDTPRLLQENYEEYWTYFEK